MQGFNMGRYYPPDASNPPRFNTTHPLGARARKANQGILTVRFELPFAVWCSHCNPPALVGQGVRFNAEKKKIGNYYSTPIWGFRMKHGACGGWWEIRTDPAKSEYVIFEGATKRDYGEGKSDGDEVGDGEMRFLSEEEKERRRGDAFAAFEGGVEQKGMESRAGQRVEELLEAAEVWKDDYDANARLRREFRGGRKVLERGEREKEELRGRYGLGIEVLDERAEDGVRAGLIEFGAGLDGEEKVDEVVKRPLFAVELRREEDMGTKRKSGKLKSEVAAEKSRRDLQLALVGNTRAVVDPFLSADAKAAPKMNLGILKRKRDGHIDADADTETEAHPTQAPTPTKSLVSKSHDTISTTPSNPAKKPTPLTALVDYDSD